MDRNYYGLSLEDFLHFTDDAVIIVDEQQSIVLFNTSAERIFEYQRQEVMGKKLDNLIPERYRDSHQKLFLRFAMGSEQSRFMAERQEILGIKKGGIEFPAEASIAKFLLKDTLIFWLSCEI